MGYSYSVEFRGVGSEVYASIKLENRLYIDSVERCGRPSVVCI